MIFADLLARWTSGVRAVPRHAFFRQVTLPIIALILLLCGLVSGGVAWEIDRSDTTVLTRQTRMARMAVDASVDDLAYQQQSDALWQPLADKVRQPHLDTAWLDENCGAWLYRMFDHDWVILLDRQDRVAYAAFHGRQVPAAAVAALRPTLQPLIDGVRGRTKGNRGLHDRRPDGLLAKGATVLTKAPAIHESDLALVGHSPAVGSAMRVMGVSADGRTASDTGFLMINLRFLDGIYLAQVSKRNLLENLHFALRDTHVAGEHSFPLFNADGETIGYFHWTPDMPGKHIVRVIVPGAIAGLALLIAALLWLERSLRRSTGRLTTSLGELADRNRELESERLAVRAAQDEREAALLREARHLDRERDTEMLRQAEEARRAELLSVAARFEESVMGAVGSVGSAAEQLAQSAIALADLSAESGRQTSQAAERVNHVSVAADAVAEGIGSLSRSISHISDRADQQASLSDEALSNTQSGTAAMQGLVGRAEGIADFTDLIATIASRTNLLALNATIEAARAGDAGRGFAVVAGEIKTLAGQAAGANKEIGSLIHAVRGSADSARHSLGDITTAVNAFATSADAIHSSVSAQRETAAMIERNASETAREAGSIAQQIHRVAEAARDAGALSRQVTGAADSLLQDATLMRGATENFLAMLRQSSGGGVGR